MHNLRLMLGTKIKTMPLQKLSQYRTGELNAVLAQNVDDSVLPMGVVAAIMFEAMVVAIVISISSEFLISWRSVFSVSKN